MKSYFHWLSIAVCLFLGTLSFAQEKPKRIVITLTDGKSLSGELVEATPAGVTVKPNAKSDPIMTPWKQIKSVGGGMTREKIVNEWRQTKAELLCDDCRGTATTQCTDCKGTQVDPAQATPCPPCNGTGATGACKVPTCVDGQIPCPDKCLKRESFTGKPDAEGKRWRKWKSKGGGEMTVSDAHIGQRVLIVDGIPRLEQTPCPTCGGTTRTPDPVCKGTDKLFCKDCNGHGVVGPACATCRDGLVPCEACNETGLKPAATPDASPTNQTGATP